MFLMFLTCISNLVQIRYYLLFDQLTYFLYTTLDYKNLKLWHLFDDIAINHWFFWNFVSIKDVIRTCNLTVRFSKFTLNINIYNEFVGFISKVWRETLFKYPCHQRQKPMHYFLTWQEPYCFCTFGINGSILCVKHAIFLQSQTWVLKKSLLPDFSPEELNWWKSLRQAKFLWQDLFKGSFCIW